MADVTAAPPSLRMHQLAAVVAGNALEFYDFLTYSYFAVYIGRTFFPSHSAQASLLMSLATFGAGFLTRPIGAIVIGSMGDRMGRKPAMIFSFALMGAAIVGLSLTPSYASIGLAAPILVLLFRLIEGFALGGDVGPTTAYLLEAAPPARRGFYTSLQYATQFLAILAGGGVGVVLATVLDAQQLQAWGWRAAMLLGVAVVPIGILVQRRLPETLHDGVAGVPVASPRASVYAILRPHLALIVFGLMMLLGSTIVVYVEGFMTTYALTTLSLPASVAFGVTLLQGICGAPTSLLGGALSDRFGRKPVMIVPAVIVLLTAIPAFWLILHFRSAAVFYGAIAWLVTIGNIGLTPVIVLLTESLPKAVRSGALATIYAFAIAIFGGSAQFMVAWLMGLLGDPLVPAYYLTGGLAICLIAMVLVRESAPVQTGRSDI